MSITNWPEAERPRERLLAHGASALSDAELLAIFLRVGVKGKSAVDLARELVGKFGSLNGLFAAPLKQLTAVNGIGEAKYVQLQAVIEMAKRALGEEIKLADALSNPRAVRDYLRITLARLPHEVFVAVFLTAQNRVIAVDELFRGTLTQTSVYPREIVKRALAHNAASVILAHNHPSGEASPSQADRMLTTTLRRRSPSLTCVCSIILLLRPVRRCHLPNKGFGRHSGTQRRVTIRRRYWLR